jgi:uncharacterized membrane protein YeaQ/YmgE (transglycosylase-associated protein family)/thiamine phosphate synthase YjbQ (UPF0047 family)
VPKVLEFSLDLAPAARCQVIDVTGALSDEARRGLRARRRALFWSPHTTAGYVEHGLVSRLGHRPERLSGLLEAFGVLFPAGASYQHDQLERRRELSEAARAVEPRNGDAHLRFISAALRNCVTYPADREGPVYWLDLDGVHEGRPRRRSTTILGYDGEEVVDRLRWPVPVSRHPVDSVNLADRRLGLLDAVEERLRRQGIEHGRVDLGLAASERGAGLTVNEYETLLMKHDLADVLRNPLRFAADSGRRLLDDPRRLPRKSRSYAAYDLVQVVNSLVDVLGVGETALERLAARLLARPARRFLRLRRAASFPVVPAEGEATPRLLRGVYQAPILISGRPPPVASGRSRSASCGSGDGLSPEAPMEVFWFIVFGLAVGIVARLIVPGRGPGGFMVTAVLGMAGSLVGGLLGRYVLGRGEGYTPGWVLSILGAVILVVAYRVLRRER